MYLKTLSLTNFKNYEEASFVFSEKINCFTGDNGAGKTNILDAIYYLSFCKSYFNSIDSQNIRHETDFFAIHGSYMRNGSAPDKLSCIQKINHRKIFRINSEEYSRLADHIGEFPLVMVSPYDRDLINDGSDVRRKYIDGVISQFDKTYLDSLLKYNKTLAQRNALLKHFAESRTFKQDSLEIYDAQLVENGQIIYSKRKAFLTEFMPLFMQFFGIVSGGSESVSVFYESQLDECDLDELLTVNVDRDRQARYTTQGIHKDDLLFKIGEYPIKKYGSQGQQKSFVIAIRLAQFEYMRQLKGFKPVLLFDDIFDKLDDHRVMQLIKLVSDNSFGQVFITDTQLYRIKRLFEHIDSEHKIFEVQNGSVNEIEVD